MMPLGIRFGRLTPEPALRALVTLVAVASPLFASCSPTDEQVASDASWVIQPGAEPWRVERADAGPGGVVTQSVDIEGVIDRVSGQFTFDRDGSSSVVLDNYQASV